MLVAAFTQGAVFVLETKKLLGQYNWLTAVEIRTADASYNDPPHVELIAYRTEAICTTII
jgi:hypothetical protein